MRQAANIDSNQPDCVRALRSAGITVQPLHQVGSGCPDLLCGFRGVNVLLEVKNGAKPPSKQALTCDEADWHMTWNGQVAVVKTPEEAVLRVLETVGLIAPAGAEVER